MRARLRVLTSTDREYALELIGQVLEKRKHSDAMGMLRECRQRLENELPMSHSRGDDLASMPSGCWTAIQDTIWASAPCNRRSGRRAARCYSRNSSEFQQLICGFYATW